MTKKNLVIKHDLSKLSADELTQYLRDVSEFIGLDPDLNSSLANPLPDAYHDLCALDRVGREQHLPSTASILHLYPPISLQRKID